MRRVSRLSQVNMLQNLRCTRTSDLLLRVYTPPGSQDAVTDMTLKCQSPGIPPTHVLVTHTYRRSFNRTQHDQWHRCLSLKSEIFLGSWNTNTRNMHVLVRDYTRSLSSWCWFCATHTHTFFCFCKIFLYCTYIAIQLYWKYHDPCGLKYHDLCKFCKSILTSYAWPKKIPVYD